MSNAPKDSKRSTKEKAAAAREAAEAEARRRERLVRLVGGVAVLAIVVGIIFFAVKGSQTNNPNQVVADAAVPTGVSNSGDYAWGVPANSAPGKPTLAIWEDFQCPVCANLEKANGATIDKLATDGKINLVWRPTTFLDQGPAEKNGPNPDSSHRATMAWGCAVDAGQAEKYHNTIFANQPATEGDGWSDQQLLDFGKSVGITGDAYVKFAACYNNKTYNQWVTNSYLTFTNDGVTGTPTGYLNGKEIPVETLADPAKLTAAVAAATSGS